MKRALALVYVLGVFFLGGTIGALAMHLYHLEQPPRHAEFDRPGPGPGHQPGIGRMIRLLDGRYPLEFLELTAEQEAEIQTILRDARDEMDTVRRELRPRMEQYAAATRARIEAVLNEQQREKLDESLSRQPPRGRGRGRGRRPPPG